MLFRSSPRQGLSIGMRRGQNAKCIDYTCRTACGGLADGGSIPPGSTNNKTPTVLGWGFFLPDRADSRVFAGVRAEASGLRRPAPGPVQGHLPLSPGHFSLRPRSPGHARSPQRPRARPLQINALRADESSGWIAALGGRGNTLSGQCPDAYNRSIQDQSGGAP